MDIFVMLETLLFVVDCGICFVFLTCFIIKKNEAITKPAISKKDWLLFGLLNLSIFWIMFLLDTINDFFNCDYPMVIVQTIFLVFFFIIVLDRFKIWKQIK